MKNLNKICISLILSTSLYAGGSFSLTMIYVGTAIINIELNGGMYYINNQLDNMEQDHKENVYQNVIKKNNLLNEIYSAEKLIAVELENIKRLDSQIAEIEYLEVN